MRKDPNTTFTRFTNALFDSDILLLFYELNKNPLSIISGPTYGYYITMLYNNVVAKLLMLICSS